MAASTQVPGAGPTTPHTPGSEAAEVIRLKSAVRRIGEVVRGKEEVAELSFIALLARGHILLEDVPGVGKTTLARALARVVGGTFNRVQLTADLLPADITGGVLLNELERRLEFRPGPLFANIVLADELNRATPRTQSGLLEAMAERSITVDGQSHALPEPFFVIATQNPTEHHGVYVLPQSQLDRFLIRSSIGYPSDEIEQALIVGRDAGDPVEDIQSSFESETLEILFRAVDHVNIAPEVAEYIQRIVLATRTHPDVETGVSTRGALQFARAVRARALVEERAYVVPEDVRALAVHVCAHRIVLRGREIPSTADAEALFLSMLDAVDVPV